jgi:hypothetical protein
MAQTEVDGRLGKIPAMYVGYQQIYIRLWG